MSFRSLSVMALPVTDIQTTVPFREQLGNKEKLGSLDIVLIHLANDISSLEIQLYEAMGITASDQIINCPAYFCLLDGIGHGVAQYGCRNPFSTGSLLLHSPP